MQSSSDMAKLRASIAARVGTLKRIVAPISAPLSAEDRRSVSFVTIELDNLVIVGLRQFTKSSLLGSRTVAGQRITAAVQPRSTAEAAAYILASLNPRGYANRGRPASINEVDEVVFRDPKRCEKVLIDYNASNLAHFTVALSLNAQVFSELKTVRHYFAHRAQNTVEAVKVFAANNGVLRFDTPEQLLMRGRPGTGVRFLDGWLAEVELFFDLAA